MPDAEQLVADAEPLDTTVRLDDAARDTLADKIGNSLAEAIGDEPVPAATPAAADPDPEPEGEPEPEPVKDGDPEPEPEPKKDGDPEPEGAADDGSPTLPEAYRRSAAARGWQEADIDRFWKADPELAIRTFDAIHQSRNAELAEFARAGRLLKQAATDPSVSPAMKPADVAAAAAKLPEAIDTEALIARFGNEELVTGIVGPVNAILAEIHKVLPEIQAGVQVVRETQQNTLGQQIEAFFTSKPLEPYAEVYGSQKDGLTDTTRANRIKVLELADAIRAGALHQGRDMGVEEALEAAHHSIASEFTVKTVRKQIQNAVAARGAAVTLKPKSGKPAAGKAGATDRLAKVQEGLSRVFGGA